MGGGGGHRKSAWVGVEAIENRRGWGWRPSKIGMGGFGTPTTGTFEYAVAIKVAVGVIQNTHGRVKIGVGGMVA